MAVTVATVLTLASSAVSIKTDRTWYLAGETMTVTITDGDAYEAYAELCDTFGLAAGVIVSLTKGNGQGAIQLPTDLHSGYYLLSAYTRNSTDVSQQLVAVVNVLHRSEEDDIEWVETEKSTAPTTPASFPLPPVGSGLPASSVPPLPPQGVHIIRTRIASAAAATHSSPLAGAGPASASPVLSSQIHPSLSVVGKEIHYFEGQMLGDSIALFYTYGIHGLQPIVLTATTDTGVNLPIEIISPFAVLLPNALPRLVFHYNRSEVEARSLDMQRLQISSPASPTGSKSSSSEQSDSQLPSPDLTYNLDEYRQFRTVREVITEYVSHVSKKKINGTTQIIVNMEKDGYISGWPALVFIDGMPVTDIDRLLSYDARRIHYINLYGGKYTFGNGVHNGILSLISRSGQLTNYPTEPNTQYLNYPFP